MKQPIKTQPLNQKETVMEVVVLVLFATILLGVFIKILFF